MAAVCSFLQAAAAAAVASNFKGDSLGTLKQQLELELEEPPPPLDALVQLALVVVVAGHLSKLLLLPFKEKRS